MSTRVDQFTVSVTCIKLKTGGYRIEVDGKVGNAEAGSRYQMSVDRGDSTLNSLSTVAKKDGPLELDSVGWEVANPQAKCPSTLPSVTLIKDRKKVCVLKNVPVTCVGG